MRKYKCNPPKPGWYLAWFQRVYLNIGDDPLDDRNAFYWTGEIWRDNTGFPATIFIQMFPCMDRWSYLPNGHPKKENKPPRKKVAPQGLYI